jgi:hypothetical protein
MQVTIDENKILTEIIERDGSLHEKIKDKVEQQLIDKMVDTLESEYMKSDWYSNQAKTVENHVLEKLKDKQTEFVKEILKEFYNSYRFKKKDLEILKKLKDFIDEN